jgi:putative hydrolase of the HAD superfamily
MNVATVFIDIGGVLLSPDTTALAKVLETVGVTITADVDVDAALYTCGPDLGFNPNAPIDEVYDYARAVAVRLGATVSEFSQSLDTLVAVLLEQPWTARAPLADSAAIAMLVAHGITVGIVSNGQGRSASVLRQHRICQVGPGPGAPVAAIVDSAEVGHAKPDPAIFHEALRITGASAGTTVHIGDSVRNDVECARKAGIVPLHFTPYGGCDDDGHPHVRSLTEFAEDVTGAARPARAGCRHTVWGPRALHLVPALHDEGMIHR